MSARRGLMSVVLRWVVFALANHSLVALAFSAETRRQHGSTQKVYLLDCPSDESVWQPPPGGLHWKTLHTLLDEKAGQLIKVADRDTVDPSLYVDMEGLRLHVSNRACRTAFEQLPLESGERITSGYFIRNLLGRRYAETGIEPDRVPVTRQAGKKHGIEGMVLIQGGEYVRPGHYYTSQSAELGERRGEKYRVRVSSFYIDKYKVTNEQYCRFLNDGNPGYWNSAPWSNIRRDADGQFTFDSDKARWPVIAVNWYQAVGYAEWAGKRLPTEAEWEFAAGGSEGRKYPWGNEDPEETRASVYHEPYAAVDALPRGATPDGVFDLAGNAAEWCADFFDFPSYERAPPGGLLIDPRGPASGNPDHGYARMFKGFCQGARHHPEFLRCTKRHARAPLLTAAISFRCVKAANEQTDYTHLARSLACYPHNPVIKVGEKGEWDDQTLGCFSVLDAGDTFYFFSGGAQYGKPKNIGMATSKDGIRWSKYANNPLFPGSMPYAIKVGDTFRLYHPGKDDAGRHGLLMRTSPDGFQWSAPRLVLAGGIMDPCIVPAEGKYYLYYCGGGRITKNGEQVWEFKAYVATSEDGITWKKEANPVLPLGPPGSWDDSSHAGPCVLELDDGFHMWYLGSGTYKGHTAWRIGHAVSPDGLHWTKSGTEPVLDVGRPGDWDCGTLMSFDIIFRDGKFLFWYAAAPTGHGDETKMTIQIGHGTSR